MALSTNLVRRGGIYYFRCRVPIDLVSRVGRTELSRSLLTANPVTARQRASWIACLSIQLWDALRMTVDPNQIAALVRRWLTTALAQDEVARTRPEFASHIAKHSWEVLEETAIRLIGSDAEGQMETGWATIRMHVGKRPHPMPGRSWLTPVSPSTLTPISSASCACGCCTP